MAFLSTNVAFITEIEDPDLHTTGSKKECPWPTRLPGTPVHNFKEDITTSVRKGEDGPWRRD
jgi:hypothetical protein